LSDSMLHDVVEVTHLGDHRLRLRFDDGIEGEIDLAPKLHFDGVFAPLKDPRYFARVRLERDGGTICWPNEADIDPVVLYSWITGRPIPDYEEDS
jgi:Protein of unknown function (DUF2442)